MILQECMDLVMATAEMKHQRTFFPLEDKTKVEPAAAFHERRNPTEANAAMEMRLAVGRERGLHHRKDLGPAVGRDAPQEARSGRKLHPFRSSACPMSRRVPARRERAASLRIRFPAQIMSWGVRPYSCAK